MRPPTLRGVPAILVLAVGVTVCATSGAVAGSLITSAQIQDDTIKSKDVHDGTLKVSDFSDTARTDLQGEPGAPGTPGVSGWNLVSANTFVDAGANGTTVVDCPDGQNVLGGGGSFAGGYDGVQVVLGPDYVSVAGHNSKGSGNNLWAYATCADVS